MIESLSRLLHLGAVLYLFVGVLSANEKILRIRCPGQALSESAETTPKKLRSVLHGTTCEKCSPFKPFGHRNSVKGNPPHVMMFMTGNRPEFLSLAAGMLYDNFQITILHFNDDSSESIKDLYSHILASVPCNHESSFHRDALDVVEMTMPLTDLLPGATAISSEDNSCGITSFEPLHHCTIQAAPRTLKILRNYILLHEQAPEGFLGKRPDALIMDSSLVGGLLVSEIWEIPTIAVASHHTLDLAIEHDPEWTPNPEWPLLYRLYRIVRQRLYSLSLTGSFLELNRIRREAGLRPLQSPVDYFAPVAALLVEFAPKDVLRSSHQDAFWQRVYTTGPLQAPCSQCLPSGISQKSRKLEAPMVMVAPPANTTARWTRSLIRGLTLARSSLESYDECEWDSLSCRNEAADFSVLWLESEPSEYFPATVPPYILRQPSVSIVDSVARHPTTIAVLAHCDSESSILELMGVSVLCVSQSERMPRLSSNTPPHTKTPLESRDVAIQLLKLMRGRNQQHQQQESNNVPTVSFDGISRSVGMIRQIVAAQRERRPWKDVYDMQQNVSEVAREAWNVTNKTEEAEPSRTTSLTDEQQEQQPYDAFTVLVAWLVLLSSGLYVILKDNLLARWRPRRSRTDSLSEGILTRLPDLDDAWATMVLWYKEQPLLMRADSILSPSAAGESRTSQGGTPTLNNHHNHYHHHHQNNIRKRRKR